MVDLSKMSDDDLLALYQQEKAKQDTGFTAPPMNAPDKIAARGDYSSAVKQIAADRAAWQGQQSNMAALDRFEKLNQDVHTGGIANALPVVKDAFNVLNPKLSEMNAISGALQVNGVPRGQGQVSNFERELFARGFPTVDKQGPVNQSVINSARARYNQQADYLDFEDAYLARNGTLNGAAEAWQRYAKANPYSVTSGDQVQLNQNRQPWRQAFGLEAAPKKQPPPQAQTQGNGWKVVKVH